MFSEILLTRFSYSKISKPNLLTSPSKGGITFSESKETNALSFTTIAPKSKSAFPQANLVKLSTAKLQNGKTSTQKGVANVLSTINFTEKREHNSYNLGKSTHCINGLLTTSVIRTATFS